MLKVGEQFAILIKDEEGEYTLLNAFRPENGDFTNEMKVSKLLQTVNRKRQQWYDTYYSDLHKHLVIAVVEFNSGGHWADQFIVVKEI
jgi:hypothetical protein